MTINASNDAFRIALGDLRAGSDRLAASRRRIGRQVEALLDGGWQGCAADAFAEAWREWECGARDVLDGLVSMTQLLAVVHRDLVERDTASQARLDAVAGRVTARRTGRLG